MVTELWKAGDLQSRHKSRERQWQGGRQRKPAEESRGRGNSGRAAFSAGRAVSRHVDGHSDIAGGLMTEFSCPGDWTIWT